MCFVSLNRNNNTVARQAASRQSLNTAVRRVHRFANIRRNMINTTEPCAMLVPFTTICKNWSAFIYSCDHSKLPVTTAKNVLWQHHNAAIILCLLPIEMSCPIDTSVDYTRRHEDRHTIVTCSNVIDTSVNYVSLASFVVRAGTARVKSLWKRQATVKCMA